LVSDPKSLRARSILSEWIIWTLNSPRLQTIVSDSEGDSEF
jgi:hypothetical protein